MIRIRALVLLVSLLASLSVKAQTVTPPLSRGPIKTLVLLLYFTDVAPTASTVGNVNNLMADADAYWRENSYQLSWLQSSVYGWFQLPVSGKGCNYPFWASKAQIVAASQGIDWAAYDRHILLYPNTTGCLLLGLPGLTGGDSISLVVWSRNNIDHEMGHTFELRHAHGERCDTANYEGAVQCTIEDYGDDRSVMALSVTSGHMTAVEKVRLAWLGADGAPSVQYLTASGDYWVEAMSSPGGGPKALAIVRDPSTTEYLFIEYRNQQGMDARVPTGVTLHRGPLTGGENSIQIDLDRTTLRAVTTLNPGDTYVDVTGVAVRTLSVDGVGALIRVDLPASTAPSAPTNLRVVKGS